MIMDKSCPGSRTIREPRPESMACPNCGKEIDGGNGELEDVKDGVVKVRLTGPAAVARCQRLP